MREKKQEESRQEDSKFGRFMGLYAFYFGALTERDGIEQWRKFVEPLDEEVLKKVLANLADFNERNPQIAVKKPRSYRIEALYRKMKPKDEPGQKYDNLPCGTCSNTGWVQKIHSYRLGRLIASHEYGGGQYAVVMTPCACPHGRHHCGSDYIRRRGAEGTFAYSMSCKEIDDVMLRILQNNKMRAA